MAKKWITFSEFGGLSTKIDPSKISDKDFAYGKNTTCNDRDRISTRNLGLEVFPITDSISTTPTNNSTLHTFRLRSGENILMWAYGTYLKYYDKVSSSWVTLKSNYTADQKFGFADYNILGDNHSYVYFGNAVENFSRWNAGVCHLTAPIALGDTTVATTSTAEFDATGNIVVNGTVIAYSAKTANSFTISASAITATVNTPVSQGVEEFAANPKGNIYLLANNRLFVAGITATPQAVYFSKYGVVTDYVGAILIDASTATGPGIFNLGEGGGAVTGASMDEGSIYFFKKSIIYKATLGDALYSIVPLKTFDGKGQTSGAIGSSVFTGSNQTYFVTPNKQLMELARIATVDYPQTVAISEVIEPDTSQLSFNKTVGIMFRDRAFFAADSGNFGKNNIVLVWNSLEKTWDAPIYGWNISAMAVYDNNDGLGEQLYLADSNAVNIYKVTDTPQDTVYNIDSLWGSKRYDFGLPERMKMCYNVFIEGYITKDTNLGIKLLMDEAGFTQPIETIFSGNETAYMFSTETYNTFGTHTFGELVFGSVNEEQGGKRKFRMYLNLDSRIKPFYNMQIEFSSSGKNQQWEILNYSFEIEEYSQPLRRELFRQFK